MLGVGLNSSTDPDRGSSCWGLVLWEQVRLLVGLSGGGVAGPGGNQGCRGMGIL